MVLLIDTNVVMDYLQERKDFFEDARKIMQWCSDGKAEGYVAFHSISNLWYLLKDREASLRRESLKRVCRILTVCGASHEAVERAIDRADFRDFEDCLQDQCALSVGADYIVTRNVRDFAHAGTKAITPSGFIECFPDGWD